MQSVARLCPSGLEAPDPICGCPVTPADLASDLANIRADRAHVRAYRETRRYREDPVYRQSLEQFDSVLARREGELGGPDRRLKRGRG